MKFLERAIVSILRPIYRALIERPLWWFLAKVKAFFFAEITVQVAEGFSKLDDLERRLRAIEERIQGVERNNAAQWDALEQLLLALFRQQQLQTSELNGKLSSPEEPSISNASDLIRAHAASNIR
ncbi:MAG: hypothetical protein WB676_30820 [Bryobacteraceae bacterium]